MTERPAHFTRCTDGSFHPTQNAQSRWGEDHLNGPALVGLAAYLLEQQFGDDEFMPARLTVDLFKAARRTPITVTSRSMRDGHRVRTSDCELMQGGVPVARATLVQYRRSEAPRGKEWSAVVDLPWPPEDDDSPLCVGSDDAGWSSMIADHRNATRKRFRNLAIDAVEGAVNSAFVNAAMSAEGASLVTNLGTEGIGYINGDLTMGLARLPVDEVICVQADSHWVADGVGVGSATLYDRMGAFGTGVVTAISNPGAHIEFADGSV
ncbi:MAG: thioesterase family protein [Actinomycetota bacterium]|nr:thioesterase family protein [Actinomycetota bacterium]